MGLRMLRDTGKMMVQEWNAKYRVGQRVLVRVGGNTSESNTASVAFLLGGSTPVIRVDDEPGYIALDRVEAIGGAPNL